MIYAFEGRKKVLHAVEHLSFNQKLMNPGGHIYLLLH
ncbi:hypothetical protein OKW21_006244 [Catalinimonas alkaloidigena]|nr:hypothetical protein [Catalinimonas alkaloidigena]